MTSSSLHFFELNTGAKISVVGLGTFKAELGLVALAISNAIKAGYRHIDYAQVYGNEKEIGSVLKHLFKDGVIKREELFITSKLWSTHHSPEEVPEALNRTLEDLQLDYVDLYLEKLVQGTTFVNEKFRQYKMVEELCDGEI